MKHIIIIGAGGFLGAIARYGVSQWVTRLTEIKFPYGTLTVNLVGSFLIGIVMAFSLRQSIHPSLLLFLTIGFLGSFTTFSTFSYETFQAMSQGQWMVALMNMAGNLFGCLIAAALGFKLLRMLSAEV